MTNALRAVLAGALAIGAVAFAGWAATSVAACVAGPNVSDVGVGMYPYGRFACFVGIATYLGCLVVALYVTTRFLRARQTWYVGALVGALAFVVVAWALLFTYG